MAQFGRALRSGRRGRKFESCRLDSIPLIEIPAYWSSGQDAALSRRKPGFDSRIGHGCFGEHSKAFLYASVAQLVARRIRNAQVAGSNPAGS